LRPYSPDQPKEIPVAKKTIKNQKNLIKTASDPTIKKSILTLRNKIEGLVEKLGSVQLLVLNSSRDFKDKKRLVLRLERARHALNLAHGELRTATEE
jgi:CRISPR/Cas system Type II protein with McrA/HNH and RuvC-like nuclease domain